jgi:SAM-dependent methyltransferase
MPLQDLLLKLNDAWTWRTTPLWERLSRTVAARSEVWPRVVMNRQVTQLVQGLPVKSLSVLEIGGANWQAGEFAAYRSVDYPEYDLCAGPLEVDAFDMVIAEQVFEHLLWPYRAAKNVWRMLRPGGHFLATTPFLVKVHNYPVDCSRWTETGLKYLLAEAGFGLEDVVTGSWGNRACVEGGFHSVWPWVPWWHSLRNEPNYPVMVWALARKAPAAERPGLDG